MADFLVNHGYLIFLVTCSAGFLAGGIFPARTLLKQIGFNLAALFFALALFEGYLWMTAGEKEKNTTTSGSFAAKGTFIDSPDLGYVIGKDGLYTARKTTADGGAVYDARYTIHDGIRATPNSTDTAGRSAFFFGCSVTFGTGVNDDQTLPFYFNEAAGGHYRVYNFGLPGYGPHQMLALVESSRFGEIPAGREGKDIAVYSFIPDHIRRSAG
ncbi:MAG TPA: hypothetical protein PKG48_11395, partial [Bacteroidales bacterium]|nr:hypothetical protein [Bacteroidales bacterium]